MTSCNSIFNVYIADGFADDCDELIHRCTQWSTLSYEKFCDVWKEMHFGAIFHGRSSSAELAELSEEVLHIAKRYMIMNSINFEETVAGLFLVYGLLNIQPFSNFASVRFTPDDVVAVDRIEFEARRTRRQDVLYILGAVLIKGPCQFHVTERERGMEFSIRKYLEGQTTVDNQGARPKGVFFRQNEELDIIRELGRLNKLYKDAKTSLGVSDKSLKYVDENLAGDLDKSLKRIIGGSSANDDDNEGTGDENDESSSPSGENAQSIKYKALRSSIQPMRHLIGIQERKTRARRSSTKSKEGISPPKGRTNSNKRRPKRRFGPHRKRGRKKNVEIETDSEEEDDIEYISLSDTDDDEDSDAEDDSAEEPDIEVGRDFQVQVQSLPTLDSNGPEYEIEFIDFQNLNRSDLTPEEGDNEERDKEEGDKETDNDIGEYSAIDEATSSDNDKFKKPVLDALLLKRLDKRQLKKPRVQTKFQRMGMLPVANFKDKRKKYK